MLPAQSTHYIYTDGRNGRRGQTERANREVETITT